MTNIPKILDEKGNKKMHHVRIKVGPTALSVVVSGFFQFVPFMLSQSEHIGPGLCVFIRWKKNARLLFGDIWAIS